MIFQRLCTAVIWSNITAVCAVARLIARSSVKAVDAESPRMEQQLTELLAKLPDVGTQANVLTHTLNVSADLLYNDYGIRYESKHTHEGRGVSLKLETQGVTVFLSAGLI